MATIKIELKNVTVSDMRRNLARALSKIKGDLKVDHCSLSLTIPMRQREFPKTNG